MREGEGNWRLEILSESRGRGYEFLFICMWSGGFGKLKFLYQSVRWGLGSCLSRCLHVLNVQEVIGI